MLKTSQNEKALTVSQQKQEPNKVAVDTNGYQSDNLFETCSCTTAVLDTLLSYLDASTVSKRDVMNLSLPIPLACQYYVLRTASDNCVLTIIYDLHVDARLLSTQVKSIKCYSKHCNHIVRNHKHQCGVLCILLYYSSICISSVFLEMHLSSTTF